MDFENDIVNCLRVLRKGGLILYPTDTIWGLGCDATNPVAVEKIYKLKKRAAEKAMIILVADEKDILRHVASPDPELFDYLSKLQKPTTVIYDGALGLADNVVCSDGSVAIRICKDAFCRQLLKRLQKPIVSSSSNFSGDVPPESFADINEEIKNGVDYVVQHRQSEKIGGKPSSLIRWNKGDVEILRP